MENDEHLMESSHAVNVWYGRKRVTHNMNGNLADQTIWVNVRKAWIFYRGPACQ